MNEGLLAVTETRANESLLVAHLLSVSFLSHRYTVVAAVMPVTVPVIAFGVRVTGTDCAVAV